MNFIDYFCIFNPRQRQIQFAHACMVRHVSCSILSIFLLVLLTMLASERKRFQICFKKNKNFFLHCGIVSMPLIPNNLRERAIGMLDAGKGILVERYEIFA